MRDYLRAFLLVALLAQTVACGNDDAGSTADQAKSTCSISGKVVDAKQAPLRGARVWLQKYDEEIACYGPASAATDVGEDGSFSFSDLGETSYFLGARADGLAVTRLDVILQKGQNQKFEIALRPAVQSVVRFCDEAGKSISGVTIRSLRCRDANGRFTIWRDWWGALGVERELSDREGRMRLPPLPDGTLITEAVFDHTEFAPVKIKDVKATDGEIATATMRPGVKLALQVAPVEGANPIGGATLRMAHRDSDNPSTIIDSKICFDDAGIATVTIEPGKYGFVRLECNGTTITPIYLPKEDEPDFEINEAKNNKLVFKVHAKTKARGRVVDLSTGQPIKGCGVSAQLSNQPATDWYSFGYGETDSDGRYELEIPAGPVRLSAYCDGFTMTDPFVEAQVKADGGGNLSDIALRAIPSITGRVVDPTGKPVVGAIVRLGGTYFGSRDPLVATGPDGGFKLRVTRIPKDWDSDGLAWVHPLDAIDPHRAFSCRTQVRLNEANATTDLQLVLKPESCESVLTRATQQTSALAQKMAADSEKDSSYSRRQSLHGEAAPELDGEMWINTERSSMSLADFRGKYVLLDFWTVWCGPCHADFPDVKLLFETYKDHGLVVIGVHDNSVAVDAIAEHVKEQGLTFPIVVDHRDGRMVGTYQKIGAVRGYPNYVLIGPDGKIVVTNEISNRKFEFVRKYLIGNDK